MRCGPLASDSTVHNLLLAEHTVFDFINPVSNLRFTNLTQQKLTAVDYEVFGAGSDFTPSTSIHRAVSEYETAFASFCFALFSRPILTLPYEPKTSDSENSRQYFCPHARLPNVRKGDR